MQTEEEILKIKKVKNTAVRTVVDRSSIFRTLKTFEENKVIHSIEDGSGMTKYAVCAEGCNCDPKDLHLSFRRSYSQYSTSKKFQVATSKYGRERPVRQLQQIIFAIELR